MGKGNKRISIIIPVYNEASTIHHVLASCQSLHPYEIIVVANGCTDGTVQIAKQFRCKLIIEKKPLGNDIGRAIGAKAAIGDILLFLDADFVISPEELKHFLEPILSDQADVVFNDFDALFKTKKRPHSTTVWRQVFNELLGRKDLNIDSILSVPHALTKEAVRKIGVNSLANPIVAQERIISTRLRIFHDYSIDVIRPNKYRPEQHRTTNGSLSPSERRIIADHIEALANVSDQFRNGYSDGGRRRDIVHQIHKGERNLISYPGWKGRDSQLYQGKQLSVIIPVQNEEATIVDVIQQVRKMEPKEMIVVVNGSTDQTEKLARRNGATTVIFKEPLGNDVGRAIGSFLATGDILLYLDGDFVIEPNELFPFVHSIANGADVALNDLNHYLTLRFPLHHVTALKYAVNLAVGRKDLGVGSLVAVPHALSRKAVQTIHWTSLVSPVVAQVKAILNGLHIDSIHRIEVDRMNRVRPDQHFAEQGYPPAVERIIGDHIEAINYLIDVKGKRGIFNETHRLLHKLHHR